MPNLLAYLMLLGSPFWIAAVFRKIGTFDAIVWATLCAYLFVPAAVGIDLPLLPPLEKDLIASLFIFYFGVRLYSKSRTSNQHFDGTKNLQVGSLKNTRYTYIGVIVFFVILSSTFTALENQEPLFYGPKIIPGLRIYDIASLIFENVVLFLPFFSALLFLGTQDLQIKILRVITLLALVYSILMLVEIRMSPQLNNWLYGFFPHSFAQHWRGNGWRPIVFLGHGLRVGIYIAMAVTAALILWRHTRHVLWLIAAFWLLFMLYLSKNLGAFSIMLLFLPLILFTGARTLCLVAAGIAGIVLLYPMIRGTGWIPIDSILDYAESINPERAQSLSFRLMHEEWLLERAFEKPLFGWGSWGRPLVYDPVTGKEESVSDGAWIIFVGVYGWFGYIVYFGLLTAPLILTFFLRPQLRRSFATSGLAVVMAINLIDLIPNSSLTPVTYLIAGSLWGSFLLYGASDAQPEITSPVEDDKSTPLPKQIHIRQPRS